MKRGLLMLLVCSACGGATAPPDEGLLDRERFTDVLLQAQLIEARVNHELMVDHRVGSPVAKYYDELFQKEGVSREQFERTFDHYAARPEELRAIYEEVIAELARRKDGPPR
jgi:hypothetical protein